MEYRFIHHWNYELGEQEHKILEAAITLSVKLRDESFLRDITAFISEHTNTTYALIGILSEGGTHIHTCSFLKNREELENITYPLEHTPCDTVLSQRFCYYPFSVTEHFPLDKELQELQIESYLGSIFLSPEGEPIGLIALMDTRPIDNAAFAEHLILVLSPAIEEELTRRRTGLSTNKVAS